MHQVLLRVVVPRRDVRGAAPDHTSSVVLHHDIVADLEGGAALALGNGVDRLVRRRLVVPPVALRNRVVELHVCLQQRPRQSRGGSHDITTNRDSKETGRAALTAEHHLDHAALQAVLHHQRLGLAQHLGADGGVGEAGVHLGGGELLQVLEEWHLLERVRARFPALPTQTDDVKLMRPMAVVMIRSG